MNPLSISSSFWWEQTEQFRWCRPRFTVVSELRCWFILPLCQASAIHAENKIGLMAFRHQVLSMRHECSADSCSLSSVYLRVMLYTGPAPSHRSRRFGGLNEHGL